MDEREKLAVEIGDPELVHYFYLDMVTLDLLGRLDSLSMKLTETQDAVPFNAQVKGYFGGEDEEGHPWILKPAADSREILYHRLCGLAYLLDHRMGTLAAPTTLGPIGPSRSYATRYRYPHTITSSSLSWTSSGPIS
jgi:hypothetical protein